MRVSLENRLTLTFTKQALRHSPKVLWGSLDNTLWGSLDNTRRQPI